MSICVFCGSSSGLDRAYVDAALSTGGTLAREGIELVYGGGRVGLMGALADAALAEGGRVTGVMPRALVEREIAHRGLTTLHVVESMHERKTKMAELATGFIALPGGAGTIEEIFEQWTWSQLGIHSKPCAFLNVQGYFDPIRVMVERMAERGFLRSDHAEMLVFEPDIGPILTRFQNYRPPSAKWSAEATDMQVRP